jgi:integrase
MPNTPGNVVSLFPSSVPASVVQELTEHAMHPHITRYLDWMRQSGYSAETITARRRFYRRTAIALGTLIPDATAAQLAGWRAALTVADRSVQRYVSYLHSFYDWAADQGLRDDNPARRLPVPRTGRLIPRPISEEDLATALATAPPRIRPWLVLAGWCGLRACEIALLRRENVLDTARPPVIVIAGNATKGSTERVVPICEFALSELRQAGLPASGWVFRRLDGQRGPNRPARVSQLCGYHLRACGIAASLHKWRHRCLTELYRRTRDLRMVQEFAGHASPLTTAGYTKVVPGEAVQAVEQLPVPRRLRPAS